ncbi:hypothetical protein NC653_015009 [Populus alba x Populus x berolinensis]|uniref:RRM domain-containing protein n=2 Tax=Populus alba x Populus x berolinensis TaxID=444605 RepID=A0AAD6QYY3_9ROSI|nr:hypothetical protein NC653_015009 [Populus alba x Populus x berolinensis]
MAYQAIPGPSSGSSSSSGFQYMNSPFGDTTYTKVFVGGLAWETQSETMRRYFEQFGDILEAVVITDKNTGRSKGYGFVTFREPEAARRACADPTPIIDGRRANCNLASLGRPRPPLPYGRPRPAAPYITSVQTPRGTYVGSFGYQQPVSYGYQQGLMYNPYGGKTLTVVSIPYVFNTDVYLYIGKTLTSTIEVILLLLVCSAFTHQSMFFPPLFVAIHIHDTNHIIGRMQKVVVAEDMCPSSMFIEQARSWSCYAAYGPEYVYQQGVYNPYSTGHQYLQIYGVPGTVNSGMYPYGQLSQNVPGGHGYTSMPGYTVPGHQIVQFGGPSVNAITTSSMPTIQAPYHTGIAAAVPAQSQFIVPAPSPQYMQGSGSDQTTG